MQIYDVIVILMKNESKIYYSKLHKPVNNFSAELVKENINYFLHQNPFSFSAGSLLRSVSLSSCRLVPPVADCVARVSGTVRVHTLCSDVITDPTPFLDWTPSLDDNLWRHLVAGSSCVTLSRGIAFSCARGPTCKVRRLGEVGAHLPSQPVPGARLAEGGCFLHFPSTQENELAHKEIHRKAPWKKTEVQTQLCDVCRVPGSACGGRHSSSTTSCVLRWSFR